ncbi:MAG TPA: trypsin-like peptidase domain-containing protein [Pseudonocardiaceae bacterium]|jgi:putative serine protease PepD|nr:trypsin-like peptidase domain-containing protein [Pseudonocardiaceae bacterium]
MTENQGIHSFPGSDTPTGPVPVQTLPPPPAPSVATRPRRSGVVALATGAAVLAAVIGGAGGALIDHSITGHTTVAAATAQTTSESTATTGSVGSVAAKVLPSVVQITQVGQSGEGIGSGVVLTSDGEILTNNHVVAGGGSLTVTFANGQKARATVLGTSPSSDLALIKAQGVSGLTAATLGDSSAVKVGQEVVAIGSPEGLQNTVTSGIVSALNRQVTVAGESRPDNPFSSSGQTGSQVTYSAIQTDAAINPGNSGGPLLDMNGNVIGINSAIYSPASSAESQGGSVGLGFAIPIDQAKTIIAQMRGGSSS